MKAASPYFSMGREILAHVDCYAAGVTVREGGLHFADKAAATSFYASLSFTYSGRQLG